jgi:ketosteroid isomerase-like protein
MLSESVLRAALSAAEARLATIALDDYFVNLDAGRLDRVMALFREDASFEVLPAGVRLYGKPEIRAFFEGVHGRHSQMSRHVRDLVIDAPRGRISAAFEAHFVRASDGESDVMHNVNFWHIEAGLFRQITVYTSSSTFLGRR